MAKNREYEAIVNNFLGRVKNARPQIAGIYLFGSRAAGKEKPDSDIDLCIIEDGVLDKGEELVKIRKLFGEDLVPIDILLFGREEFEKRKDIWGTVQYEIDKKGKRLYERGD